MAILLLTTVVSLAQRHYNTYVQVDAGFTIALADVKRYDFAPATQTVNELQMGSGVEATIFLNENIGINGDVHYFTLAGISPEHNVQFNSSVWAPSVSLSLTFNSLFEENLRSPWNRRFKMFGKMGYGHLFYESELLLSEGGNTENLDVVNYSLGKTSGGASFFPVEVSLMYKLNKFDNQFFTREKDRLYLVMSGCIAFADTDELDNVTGRDFSKDAFTYFSVGISYFMGR